MARPSSLIQRPVPLPSEQFRTISLRKLSPHEITTKYAVYPYLALAIWQKIDVDSQQAIIQAMRGRHREVVLKSGKIVNYADVFQTYVQLWYSNPKKLHQHYQNVPLQTGNENESAFQSVELARLATSQEEYKNSQSGWLPLPGRDVIRTDVDGRRQKNRLWTDVWVNILTGEIKKVNDVPYETVEIEEPEIVDGLSFGGVSEEEELDEFAAKLTERPAEAVSAPTEEINSGTGGPPGHFFDNFEGESFIGGKHQRFHRMRF